MIEWYLDFSTKYSFYIIFVLSVIVYEVGFSKKLPIIKRMIIYILLFIGCIPLQILKVLGLPIIQALLIALLLLVIVRFRSDGSLRED